MFIPGIMASYPIPKYIRKPTDPIDPPPSPPPGVPDGAINISRALEWTYSTNGAQLTLGDGWPDSYEARITQEEDGIFRLYALSNDWNEAFNSLHMVFTIRARRSGSNVVTSTIKLGSGLASHSQGAGANTVDERIVIINRTAGYIAANSHFNLSITGNYYSAETKLLGVWVTI